MIKRYVVRDNNRKRWSGSGLLKHSTLKHGERPLKWKLVDAVTDTIVETSDSYNDLLAKAEAANTALSVEE